MAKGSKAAATAAGVTKGAAKALEGYPGIFHHLAGEHAEVATLMKRITQSDGRNREEVFPELRLNLLAHAHAEEEEFYPRLSAFEELDDLVARCLEQHKDVESQLEQLNVADKHSDAWMQAFDEMKRDVEAHVELEERQLFPKARELMSRDQANEMQRSYEEAEEHEKSVLA